MHQLPNSVHAVDLTGKLLPCWHTGQPVLVVLEDDTFLPLFTDVERLHAHMKSSGVQGYKVMHVDHGPSFLASVIGQVRVMLDPWFTDRGTTRFTEVKASPDQN